ncbi:Golgi-associated plant pathogenesis-related protein 1-like [Electrophorus electricus]|uniref:Golgi-associated plant pathogenesis-related protein 1-like n=1 Tax=Electrophorus electricus TaxID=8005 RepID=UPI0015CFC955|nr:Golgi-associated plant pathogenesis-related protein 1-like [Electrophorus electricus]
MEKTFSTPGAPLRRNAQSEREGDAKGNEPVDKWYIEIKGYDFSKPGFQPKAGHFTQILWKSSQEVRVGIATDGNTVFVVGQYKPPSNITNAGYYEDNVLPADK